MAFDPTTYIEQIKNEADFFKKAEQINFLKREKQMRIKEIAKHLAMKESYICHILRLLRLPEIIIDGYYSEQVSISHLFIIARLKDKDAMLKVYEQVLAEGLTSGQTEHAVRNYLYGINPKGERLEEYEIKSFLESLAYKDKHIKASVVQTRIKGKIILELSGDLEKTSAFLRKIMAQIIRD